jgi:hypothetical protein
MTLPSLDTSIAYAGDGVSTVFPVPFVFFGPDELAVHQTSAAGVLTTLARGTDYTVAGGDGASGSITALAAPAVGVTWRILRATVPTQQVRLNNADPLPGPTVERIVDRGTALAQEALAAQRRTLRVPDGEADQPVLPARASRRSMNVITDANGDITVGLPASGTATVSAPMVPVVAAAALRTARLTLGGPAHVDLVRDHGADNTGTADCAAALQAAINSLTSGVVYLRPGTYRLNSDVTLKPNVTVIGDDPLITTLVAGANNLRLLKYVAAAPAFPFTIRRLGFSAGGYTGVYAVHLDGTDVAKRCSFVSLEDLYITSGARGINLRFCASTILDTIRCTAAAIGIHIDTCTDTEVNGGYAQSGSDFGIYITGSGGTADEGVRVTAFNTNGQVKGGGVSGQDWGSFTGCAFTNCSGGPLTFINAANWKVATCDLSTGGGSPATPGVQADANCRALQLVGNRAPTNTYGIDLQGEKHVVMGNHLAGNSNNDIRLRCTRSVVQGNLCDSTGVAVSILESGTADFNVIAGNVTNGTVTVIGAGSASNGNNVVY